MVDIIVRKSKRGFASMDPERQREIARKGGMNVPADKRSFAKNPDLASKAGKIGGQAVAAESRSFSKDRLLATEAGRKGGRAAANAAEKPEKKVTVPVLKTHRGRKTQA